MHIRNDLPADSGCEKIPRSIFMPRMPHSLIWQRRLSIIYDDQKANALIARAQVYYDDYCSQHSAEANRANRTALKTRVLPGLSIYKALLEKNDDQQKVLAEVDTLFRAVFFTRRMQGIRVLNHFSNPFPIVKPMLKMMTRNEYVPGAQEVIEDSADCFALNVYRCFILDTLARHNAKELTALYCNTDDWLAEVLPKISWERTKTLGRGGDCCDFRWSRNKI
jgi:hypothetical protein